MSFSVVLTLTLFQSAMGAEVAPDASDDNIFIECLYALIRVALLSATFVLGQRALKERNGQNKKVLKGLPCISRGTSRTPTCHGRYPKKLRVASDDEDDLSTSVGSSDSESDMLSSDDERNNGNSTKISMADLLRCRPIVGPAPIGSLRAMPFNDRASVSRQQFEERRWENVRIEGAASAGAASKPVKIAATKQALKSDSKAAKAAPGPRAKAPRIMAAPVLVDAATAAANSARMAALLEIICPEDAPAVPKTKAAPPPWRRQPVTETPSAPLSVK